MSDCVEVPQAQYDALMKAAYRLRWLRARGYITAFFGRKRADETLDALTAAGVVIALPENEDAE